MMLIFGLMLLLKTAACVEFNCSFLQSDPCSAVLGDKLSLQLLDAGEYHDLKIQKRKYNTQDDPVCIIKNDRINKNECDLFNNRHDEVSVIKGILIINTVIRAESGNYRLHVSNSYGTVTSTDLLVIVEVPVFWSETAVHVLVWCCQMMVLLGLLGGFHIYMKLTSGKKQEDQSVRMRRFREGHEDTAED